MSHPVDRTVPASMIRLITLALETGLDKVSLGFEGMGHDFPAPIGWLLHLRRLDCYATDEQGGNFLTVSVRVGEEATAYVGPMHSANPYLDEAQIAAWITAPRPGARPYTAEECLSLAQDVQVFLAAVANGWEASRELRRGDALSLEEHLPSGQPRPVVTKYSYSALNWFYNTKKHPGYRKNGTEVSQSLTLIKAAITATTPYYCAQGMERISEVSLREKLGSPAPFTAPVAYTNEELDDWVL